MSLGKDFAVLRNNLGFSLEEVHSEIKIPKSVLESIENDSIFDEQGSNKTYIRSFVRSYGKFLGLSEEVMVQALDLFEANLYVPGSILEGDLIKSHGTSKISDPKKSQDKVEKPSEEIKNVEEIFQNSTINNVNWADLGKQFSAPSTNKKLIYPVVIAFCVLGITILVYVLKQPILDMFSPSSVALEQENDPVVNEIPADSITTNEPSSDSNPPITEEEPSLPENTIQNESSVFNPVLSDTLTLTIYAAFDK